MKRHLILFDGTCHICNLAIKHIVSIDSGHRFHFSSLQSDFAKKILGTQYEFFIQKDSIVLIEHFRFKRPKVQIRSRAILRIYWHIGGKWKILGLFSFCPSYIGDTVYRVFAAKRKKWFIQKS